jgi:hypothetical protein
MRYEIRYIVDNNEFTEIVDVETAAEAAEAVKQHHPNPGDTFELIQVQLLDEFIPNSDTQPEEQSA